MTASKSHTNRITKSLLSINRPLIMRPLPQLRKIALIDTFRVTESRKASML